MAMLGTLLLLLLLTVGVGVLFAAGTLVIQGYWYSRPVEGIAWRSAVAAVIVGAYFGLWCWLEAQWPGRYETLLRFNPTETKEFDKIWSVRTGERGTEEILFTRSHDARGRVVYLSPDGRPWQRSGEGGMMTTIIVEEDGERRRFEAETEKGAFKDPLRYVEVGGRGRVMTGDALGEVTVTRWGWLVGNLLLNLAHLAVWFVGLWLVLEFQWPHALGLAAALAVSFAMVVWPLIRDQVPHAA